MNGEWGQECHRAVAPSCAVAGAGNPLAQFTLLCCQSLAFPHSSPVLGIGVLGVVRATGRFPHAHIWAHWEGLPQGWCGIFLAVPWAALGACFSAGAQGRFCPGQQGAAARSWDDWAPVPMFPTGQGPAGRPCGRAACGPRSWRAGVPSRGRRGDCAGPGPHCALDPPGATRDIGSALTRMCMRHRSIETKLRQFTK